jgi:hypothetical protein
MKVLFSSMLVLACSIANASSTIECAVTDVHGNTKPFVLRYNMPAAFDGAAPGAMFFEKGANLNGDAYCEGEKKSDDANFITISGILMNSNASCELSIDSKGNGEYVLKFSPLSMGGDVRSDRQEVKCHLP